MTLGAVEGARLRNRSVEVRLAIDFEPSAIKVYRENFGVSADVAVCAGVETFFPGDLRQPLTEVEREAAKRVGHLDLLMAGPPCQGHSDLNNRSRRNDPRNALYRAAVRMVEVLRPAVVVIENVPGVIHDSGRISQSGAEFLVELGYSVFQGVVLLSDLGLAQSRRRHVTVAARSLSQEQLESLLMLQKVSAATVADFIDDLADEPVRATTAFRMASRASSENIKRINWLFDNRKYNLPNELRPPCHRDKDHSYRSMYGRLSWDAPSQTITSGFGSMGQGRYVHPSRRRTLTCHEAARIQGFPDFFRFDSCDSVTSLRQMIGNAVPPALCAELVRRLF
jgi:DNA (cytosine-5)-methyltransferase 1